jgi:hypothetical protein
MERFHPTYAVHREDACGLKTLEHSCKNAQFPCPEGRGKTKLFRVAKVAILAGGGTPGKENRRRQVRRSR